MTTVILSAADPAHPSLSELETLVEAELRRTGETEIRSFALASTKLAYCQGEFDCWIKTPGECRARDAEQGIVQAIHDADNLVLLDVITDGGHSYTLKRALDRVICLLSPFFEKRASLTHHEARYADLPNLFALGWLPAPDAEQARTYGELADANAINLFAPRVGVALVDDRNRDAWGTEICAMLASRTEPGARIDDRRALREALNEAARPDAVAHETSAIRTAAILIGSAKIKGTSASEVLARYCAAELERAGVAAELHFVTELLHDRKAAETAQAIARADLFVLVTPLYIDALPALVVHALDCIAEAHRGAKGSFAAIINCGFPEPEHTRTAFRIARHFSTRADYRWLGGLPIGGGGVVQPAKPLATQHGPVEHIRRSLDLAIPALARGEAVPEASLELMLRAPLPDFAYRVMGDIGWRYQAHKNGLHQRDLRARPLDGPVARGDGE